MVRALLDRFGGLQSLFKNYNGILTGMLGLATWLAGASLLSMWFLGREALTDAGLAQTERAPELVLVPLDEVFAEHYDYPTETPKAYLAEVVAAVAAHSPRVIALDYWLTNADLGDPGFAALVEAVEEAPPSVRFVFPTRLIARDDGHALLDVPPAPLRRHVLTGYADLWGEPVMDARLARTLAGGEKAPSLALAALTAFTFPDVVAEAESVADSAFARTDSTAATSRPIEVVEAAHDLLGGGKRPWPPTASAPTRASAIRSTTTTTSVRATRPSSPPRPFSAAITHPTSWTCVSPTSS